ncbi:MAG TPA: DUF2892 domain-containing protein [Nitrolancea sp.]|nr:DUF2892 domain-containing protein [Nitrolancea sp.]
MSFVNAMQSPFGRVARILVGIGLILGGLIGIQGTWGVVLAVIGLVPLFAGVARVCLVAPLLSQDIHQHQ